MLKFVKTHLQAKLTLAFAAVVLIPTIIIATFMVDSSSKNIIHSTSKQELNTADQSVIRVQEFLSRMKADLFFLQHDSSMRTYVDTLIGANNPNTISDVQNLFSNMLGNTTSRYKDIRILDANGQEVVRVDATGGEPKVISGADLENKANRPYYLEAIKLTANQVYFSGLDLNVTRGKIDNPPLPVMRYSMPLYATNGQVAGVLVLKAFAAPLLSTLVSDEQSETTSLFDVNGNYWLNADDSKLYGTILAKDASFVKDQPLDAAYIKANNQGVITNSSERPDAFQSFVHIPLADQPGNQWTLLRSRPLAEILADVSQVRNEIIALSVVAFLVALSAAGIVTRSIVKPVRQLTSAAAEISLDHWDAPLPSSNSQDEIGSLAASFRLMVQAVQNRNTRLSELNQSLTEQTKELTKANALARESARLKSEFMSTMSHELRTPLNAILGFSGIMLEGMGGEMDEDALHMIRRIDSNSQRLLGLINSVLDLAKIEAGRLELAIQPFAPRKLAERWKSEMSVLAEKKGLQFSIKIDSELPDTLFGDTERITQIVVNLLSNAFKFTQNGQVTLDLAWHDMTWSLRVSDTGIGIPPHALNYIFDEFRQVDGSTMRAYGGSGLGLSIVRNMCRMMDGTVQVASELGKGSVFTVTLPLSIQEAGVDGHLSLLQTA